MRELFPVDSESTETSLVLRTEDGANVTKEQISALGGWNEKADPDTEIAVGVGASGTRTEKQRTPISCSSSSTA